MAAPTPGPPSWLWSHQAPRLAGDGTLETTGICLQLVASFNIPQPISAATSVSIGKHQSNRETKKISLKSYFMTQVTSVKMSYLALISGRNMT